VTAADLIVRETSPGWWAAKCRHCGVWLSKFDFTREECVAIALGSPVHDCTASAAPRLFG
jgi:hypothetical protein